MVDCRITARDILEAFVAEDLYPVWGTFGDGKETGCGATAYAVHALPRVAGSKDDAVDQGELKRLIGVDNYFRIVTGFEDSHRPKPLAGNMTDWENPYYKAGREAADRLLAAGKDPHAALMEMDLENVRERAALA